RVTVSQDADVLTVNAEVASMLELGSPGVWFFMLDTDGNAATGSYAGADYVLFYDSKTFEPLVEHWNGKAYVAAKKVSDPSRSLISGHGIGFEFNLANLGWPKHIGLSILIARGEPDEGLADRAPDAGAWDFAVRPAMDTLDLEFGLDAPRAGA